MKHDYTDLDAAIVARLKGADRPQMSWRLWADARVKQASLVISDAENFGVSPWSKTPDYAPLARRLQALRKAGHIRYQRKPEGWVLTDEE